MNIWEVLFPLAAYLIGAIPFGLIVARFAGVGDIRAQGSGNIGATNVLRVAGRKAGALALFLDMSKGALVAAIATLTFGADAPITASTVICAFLGHLYPVYLKFKGGKGVAVALGALLAWTPLPGAIMVITWLGMAKGVRISSLAALSAFVVGPVSLIWLSAPPMAPIVHGSITLLVFWRHRENIRRLIAGTEPTIGKKNAPSTPVAPPT
ncbi:MAG: glycerol-3-phosphate 1-O-acyltransferase PlsY [Magnetococcales bacterium]|nr:glycerol-3-phosphate 1-O-acyltransferase PlsY [Magnetococcales bacterium]